MRISINDSDPGFVPWIFVSGVRVWLDGVEITKVITADEEARSVERFATDEQGRCYLNEARDEAVRETLRGTVRIELPQRIIDMIDQGRLQRPVIGMRQRIEVSLPPEA